MGVIPKRAEQREQIKIMEITAHRTPRRERGKRKNTTAKNTGGE